MDTRTDVRKIERFAASATMGRFLIVEEDVVAGTVVVVAAVIGSKKTFASIHKNRLTKLDDAFYDTTEMFITYWSKIFPNRDALLIVEMLVYWQSLLKIM